MSSYQYRVEGKAVVLEVDEDHLAVRFKEPALHSTRLSAARGAGIQRFNSRLEVPNEKFTILNVQPKHRDGVPTNRAASVSDTLSRAESVDRVAPVFRHGAAKVFASDRVLVGLRPQISPEPVADAVGAKIIDARGDEYVLQLAADADPLQCAAILSRREDVDYAEPDFVSIMPKLARRSESLGPRTVRALRSLDVHQYAMHVTRAVEAWQRVAARKDIRIAILDEGVDTSHSDLKDAVVGTYDAIDDDSYQEPNPWDGHGTACAGLAAGLPNGIGIRGLASGCSLLAVRIAYTKLPGGEWVLTTSGVSRAIDWAARNGADVLSNSWGGGAPSTPVTRAIERARKTGRGGKGCVVVIAAGNQPGPVLYPGHLPEVLCVAATNEFDQPKTLTSQDGESWWGSAFGPEVSLAAPGVHNVTTDITGTGGYSPGPDNPHYVTDFNGTSSAAPLVAGAAALILSVNPDLSEAEVRRILLETADRVGSVAYDDRGHNHYMGFGRLNVLAAVERALSTVQPGVPVKPVEPLEPAG